MRVSWLTGLVLLLASSASCTMEPGVAVPGTQTAAEDPTTPARTPKPELPEEPPAVVGGPSAGRAWEQPCRLLDDTAAARIGVLGPAVPGPGTSTRASCVRKADGERLEYEVFSLTSMFYGPYLEPGRWGYYAEATVGGRPTGVFSEESQPKTSCGVAVGLNETASVHIDLRVIDDPDVCGRALAVAAHVVGEIVR